MKIDRKLNLVVELPRGVELPDGSRSEPSVITHSSALKAEVLEQYHGLAGPTMNALMVRGYGYYAPRYAASVLREVASEQAMLTAGPNQASKDAAEQRAKAKVSAFFAEMIRTTQVLTLTDNGWESLPIGDAKRTEVIDDEEYAQVENALAFFTLGSRTLVKAQRDSVNGGLNVCNARIESLNCTEFISSLPILTRDGNSGKSQDASPPSSNGSAAKDSAPSSHAPTHSRGPLLPHIGIGT